MSAQATDAVVLEVLARVCARPREALGRDQRLAGDLEIDSVKATELLFELEEQLEIEIEDEEAVALRTVADLLDFAARKVEGDAAG